MKLTGIENLRLTFYQLFKTVDEYQGEFSPAFHHIRHSLKYSWINWHVSHDAQIVVKRIEKEKEFLPSKGKQCDWCAFKAICPEWKHLYKIEDKKPSEYLKDNGVKLVNKYSGIYYECRKLQDELERLKEVAKEYAAKKGVKRIFGSDHTLTIGLMKRVTFPEKEKLIE